MLINNKRWAAVYNGDRIDSIACVGPLWDDDIDEYPKYSGMLNGDLSISVIASDINMAIAIVNDIIENSAWEDEG